MSQFIEEIAGTRGGDPPGDTLAAEAARLGADPDYLRAIVKVESSDRAYDHKGRLDLLPEKHRFWAELPASLRGAAQRAGLANKKWSPKTQYKGLGNPGDDRRWKREGDMADIDEAAAIKATSWSKSQIMGRWYKDAGYASPQAFILAMAENESAQDKAFVTLIERWGLKDELIAKDSRAIARVWNGSGQVAKYASLIDHAYEKLTGGKPEIADPMRAAALRVGSEGSRVKALQERLDELGFHVVVDSDFGEATRRQVWAFQAQHGLKPDGIVGPKTQQMLDDASPLDMPGREDATLKDLREKGSRTVAATDAVKAVGGAATAVGGAAGVAKETGVLDQLQQAGETASQVNDAVSPFQSLFGMVSDYWWVPAIVIGVLVVWFAVRAARARLDDHRTGKTA